MVDINDIYYIIGLWIGSARSAVVSSRWLRLVILGINMALIKGGYVGIRCVVGLPSNH